MKILQIHNLYRQAGGEDVVAEQEAKLLMENGHQVDRWIRDNKKELKSPLARLRLPFTTHFSSRSLQMARQRLRKGRHDLMHVHNFFPLFTPSIFRAARQMGVPSVMTLHNYRLIHPNGQLYTDGEIDERSVGGSAWRCVPDGVYRGSILQTAVVARMIEYHRKQGTWDHVPSLFITLTRFAREKLAEGGLPADRMVVKPNFIEDPGQDYADTRVKSESESVVLSGRFLFVGRISEEKGVEDLIRAWISQGIHEELRIAGDGPEKERLQSLSDGTSNIRWLGRLDRDEVRREMAMATALVLPSRWYEGFPMTLVEAFSVGCPAIVTGIGSQAEIVIHEQNGFHVTPGDDAGLAYAVRRMAGEHSLVRRFSENARAVYRTRYTPEVNYRLMAEIHQQAVEMEKRLAGDGQ